MKIQLDLTVPIILLIIFIAFKLTHIIAWSWFWVLSPIWIYGIFILILFAIVLLAHCNIRKR